MRILVINPNSDRATAEILKKKAESILPQEVSIRVVCLTQTPLLIRTYRDCAIAAAELVSLVEEEQERYDAFVIACHSDPGLEAAREISQKPVWGIGEASFKTASFFGNRIMCLVPSAQTGQRKNDSARKYFVNENFYGNMVSEGDNYEQLLEAGRKARDKGAGVLVLGCANYSAFDGRLERDLGIPVLDGLACALGLAYGFHRYLQAKKRQGGGDR